MWKNFVFGVFGVLCGLIVGVPLFIVGQDWYEATGKPVQRGALNSADLRTEFALIESDIAAKLPTLTGNGGEFVAVNAGGTALETVAGALTTTTGSFVASFDTACTTTPTITFQYRVSGPIVSIWASGSSGFPCTSDSSSFQTSATPLPAAIRPSSANGVNALHGAIDDGATDNGALTAARISFNTSGVVFIEKISVSGAIISGGNWTAAGNKAYPAGGGTATVFTYGLGS